MLRLFTWLLCLACVMPAASGEVSSKRVFRQPGLWEVRLWQEGKSVLLSQRVLQCSSIEVEPTLLLSIVPGQEHCGSPDIQISRGRLRIRTACEVHNRSVSADMHLTGDRKRSYKGVFEVSGAAASGPARVQYAGIWLGECTGDVLPGQMQLPSGIVVDPLRDKVEAEAAHTH